MPLLQMRGLSLRIGDKDILQGITLDVQPGEFLALVGPNGAGKTTLIKCMAGLYRNWQGEILLAGQDLRKFSRRATACRISYVSQTEEADIPFTCLEFVLMSRYPHLSPFTTLRRADREAAEQALVLTGMQHLSDRRMDTLSGGERRMVMIAAALAQGADLMLLDEPTAFLDYRHQRQVLQLLGDLNRRRGLTVVAALHDINTACRWSVRVAALRDGRLVYCTPPADLLRLEALRAVYNTSFDFVRLPSGRSLAVLEDVW